MLLGGIHHKVINSDKLTEESNNDDDIADTCALWIGNITPDIHEYELLRVAQQFGKLTKFDFPLHQGGPEFGKPRGFCFITYSKPEEAQAAFGGLNFSALGLRAHHNRRGNKNKLIVDYARGKYTKLSRDVFVGKDESQLQGGTLSELGRKPVKSNLNRMRADATVGADDKKLQQHSRFRLLDKMAKIEAKLKEMDHQRHSNVDPASHAFSGRRRRAYICKVANKARPFKRYSS